MDPAPAARRLAFAVRHLERAQTLYETLFLVRFAPSRTVVAAEVRCLEAKGTPTIELVSPVDQEGAVARFIRKRGEGLHHVSIAVEDLEAALTRFTAAGGRVIRVPSYYRAPDGAPLVEAFLHPKDVHGVLFHLYEEPE